MPNELRFSVADLGDKTPIIATTFPSAMPGLSAEFRLKLTTDAAWQRIDAQARAENVLAPMDWDIVADLVAEKVLVGWFMPADMYAAHVYLPDEVLSTVKDVPLGQFIIPFETDLAAQFLKNCRPAIDHIRNESGKANLAKREAEDDAGKNSSGLSVVS